MFSFSLFRILAPVFVGALLLLPLPLQAETEQAVLVAAPAPSVVVPEPVAIRAESQPLIPPPAEKPSSAFRVGIRSAFPCSWTRAENLSSPR